MLSLRPRLDAGAEIRHGSVLIAAITSCTNTSNPSVMLAAGLLAKKAVERGLKVNPLVKTSLAPGSRVVTDYLEKAGLQFYLDQLGFNLVGYGCTTCIGNSGPLAPPSRKPLASTTSLPLRSFPEIETLRPAFTRTSKRIFLMSPPLVVAFALAGRVDIDSANNPSARARTAPEVYLRDVWPTLAEIQGQLRTAVDPRTFRRLYKDFAEQNPKWNEIPSKAGNAYEWEAASTYIQEPPFFTDFSLRPGRFTKSNARGLWRSSAIALPPTTSPCRKH
jgi:aconitate hydratase